MVGHQSLYLFYHKLLEVTIIYDPRKLFGRMVDKKNVRFWTKKMMKKSKNLSKSSTICCRDNVLILVFWGTLVVAISHVFFSHVNLLTHAQSLAFVLMYCYHERYEAIKRGSGR